MIDEEVMDAIVADESTVWHPILRTCREELREACRGNGGFRISGELLRVKLKDADEEQIGRIAEKLGDRLMQGGDYWEAIPYAVEAVLFP